MSGKAIQSGSFDGLSAERVAALQQQFGKNVFKAGSSRHFIHIVWDIVREPMFILLVIACSIYFILGEISEGIMMGVAMVIVATISLYQEVKSTNAINALKQFTEPKVKVVRDGTESVILTHELVPGDIMLLEEGMNIPADAIVVQPNDFSINESIITGESLPVDKYETEGNNQLYQGTTINSGKCIARVTETGNNTVLGKLGKSVEAYHPPKTLLQSQINRFVSRLALFGLIGFLIIFFVNFFDHREWTTSLLLALTLAMSAVPEEIPVAFSSFMALGAYKMSRFNIISRQPQVVENLGAVSVICLDKTGTITENRMQVTALYDYGHDTLYENTENTPVQKGRVMRYAVLASEEDPFDDMEKAICTAYDSSPGSQPDLPQKKIYEYPLQGQPPMMTHVFEDDHQVVVAAKGGAERILRVCRLNEVEKNKIMQHVRSMASRGYRVIGVASAEHKELKFPDQQDDFDWHFEGLVALFDPPKKNLRMVLKQFYDARIDVKLLTGDYPETAINIAGQVGILNHLKYVTGESVIKMTDGELREVVKSTAIFARMYPEAKLKVIDALKANGEIVAMTGDGVNDAPALKSSSIGIAMGQRGTEIARQASDLILTDDNLGSMVMAISEGRKIFNNLKKAVRYIISIHIPIILIASLPLLFGWVYPTVFTPIHVIFLELIMGPTCSIFFEKEPVEQNLMTQKPRERNSGMFTREELLISVIQGLVIAAACLILYYYSMNHGATLEQTRTLVFTTLILSNVFLTFANRSFTKTIFYTSRFKNNLAPFIVIISMLFLAVLYWVPFIRDLFQLTLITPGQFGLSFGVAFAAVMWFEIYKTDLLKLNTR